MSIEQVGQVRESRVTEQAPSPSPSLSPSVADARTAGRSEGRPEPSPSPGPQPTPPPRETGDLQVGNMNVGGGNKEARANFDEIKRTIGEQVTRNGIDVATFQEVEVGTRRIGGRDYNKEILSGVFEADLGGRDTRQIAGTNQYETTLPNGDKAVMTITEEELEGEGRPRIYTARYKNERGEDVEYTMVYGKSIDHQGGTFGNSVLLGPGQSLPRDENGRVKAGAVAIRDLGTDDPHKGENRTALEVNTADGHTVFSTHLTAGSSDAQQEARRKQYETLRDLAADKPRAIMGGDFNSEIGESYRTGGILGGLFGDEHRYLTDEEMGLDEATSPDGFDHILVRGGRSVGGGRAAGVEDVHDFQWVDVQA